MYLVGKSLVAPASVEALLEQAFYKDGIHE
jgi:hypothetical protein